MAITLHKDDIPANLSFGDCVAIDTESLGLNWERDRLCLVQLSAGDGNAHLVQLAAGNYAAPNLKKLLADSKVTKLFHFARADLATLAYHLGVMPQPVYCTKIASVLVRTFSDRHSLKDLCRDLLGLELSKEQQTSDWGREKLGEEQLSYAASDVLHLHKLKVRLDEMLARESRAGLAKKVFDFLPTRVELDLAGWRAVDIFSYRPIARLE
jgi:ribonuclease D